MPMNADGPAHQETGLPREILDRLLDPLVRFLHVASAAGAMLLVFAVAAVVVSNSPWAASFEHFWETRIGIRLGTFDFSRSLREWINDGLMTLFFFLVALELKRALVLGDLSRPRQAALSISAAIGGMLVPASIYLLLHHGQPGPGIRGWGTVMATDTAFVIGCLALLGRGIPNSLRVFMLSLAIVDDIGAILVVAIGYSDGIAWLPLLAATLGLFAVRAMSSFGFRGFPLYFLVGGFVWLAIDASGVHATLAGVALGLMTPARRWVSDTRLYAILHQVVAHPDRHSSGLGTSDRRTLQMAEIAARETLSPVERLEVALHPWVGFVIMPLFAFANAGLPLSLTDLDNPVTYAIVAGFVIGKPVGILAFSYLAIKLRIAVRPDGLGWGLITGGGFLAGIGFTMALFIANLGFDAELIGSAKMGIFLASIVSATLGLGVLIVVLRRSKRAGLPRPSMRQ